MLFIRGVTLEGAGEGIRFYLSPDFSTLGKSQVWLDAAGQILYSLSPGFGTLIAYASYNKRHNDTLKDALLVSHLPPGLVLQLVSIAYHFVQPHARKTIRLLLRAVRRSLYTHALQFILPSAESAMQLVQHGHARLALDLFRDIMSILCIVCS